MTDAELRELDARVHREVIGGEVKWEYGHPYTPSMTLVPHYSTDIAAAWRVVEWLRERWGQVFLCSGLEWHCYSTGSLAAAIPEGSGDTVQLAICLAALKALEARS